MKKISAFLTAAALLLSVCAGALARPAGGTEDWTEPCYSMDDEFAGLHGSGGPETGSAAGTEKQLQILAEFNDASPENPMSVPTVYSYTLAWEDLTPGTYHRTADTYVWNAEDLTYTRTGEGHWELDALPRVVLKVTNRSNIALDLDVDLDMTDGMDVEMGVYGEFDGWTVPAAMAQPAGLQDGAWWNSRGTEQTRVWDCRFTVYSGFENLTAEGGSLQGRLGTLKIGVRASSQMPESGDDGPAGLN